MRRDWEASKELWGFVISGLEVAIQVELRQQGEGLCEWGTGGGSHAHPMVVRWWWSRLVPVQASPGPFGLADLHGAIVGLTSQMESCLVWNRLCVWVRGWAQTRMCWLCFSTLMLNSVWFYASELRSSPVRRQAVHVGVTYGSKFNSLNHQMHEPSLLWWILM